MEDKAKNEERIVDNIQELPLHIQTLLHELVMMEGIEETPDSEELMHEIKRILSELQKTHENYGREAVTNVLVNILGMELAELLLHDERNIPEFENHINGILKNNGVPIEVKVRIKKE